MPLVTEAVSLVAAATVVTALRRHLYLWVLLCRWPDENDLLFRHRDVAERRHERRAERAAGPVPRRMPAVRALAVASMVVLSCGVAMASAAAVHPDRQRAHSAEARPRDTP